MWIASALAFLLLAWLLPSLWRRVGSLTLADVFLLSIAAYYGAYTLADLATIEPGHADTLPVLLVFLPVFTTALSLRFLSNRFTATSLTALQSDWRSSSGLAVMVLIGLCLAYRALTLVMFADYYAIRQRDLDAMEQELPYWYTALGMISTMSVYAGGLAAWGKATASKGVSKLFWLALVGASLFMILGTGRRAILAFAVMVGWSIFYQQRMEGRRLRGLVMLVLAVPLLIIASNVYQAYRLVSYRGVPLANMESVEEVGSAFEAAMDAQRTLSNLEQRQAIWRFNYEVTDAHLRDKGSLQWGKLFALGFGNYIPSILYRGKEVVDVEDRLLQEFALDRYDRAGNVFAYTYADFGVLAVLVAPAFFLLFLALTDAAMRRMRDPFLRMTLMGFALYYALNLETNYLTVVQIMRDYIVVAGVYVAVRMAFSLSRGVMRTAVH